MKGLRVVDNYDGLLRAGEYTKWTTRSGVAMWMACTPNGLHGNLSGHTVVEHEDGTITVTPSILVTGHDARWHGVLKAGVWEPC